MGYTRYAAYFLGLVAFLLVTIHYQNCAPVNFSSIPPGSVSTTGGTSCPIANIAVPVKILFVVDRSGSNVEETQDRGTVPCTDPSMATCAPPTDPNKNFRGSSISAFFNANQGDSNLSWGFLAFSGSGAEPYILNLNGQGTFSNATQMSAALNTFYSDTDQDSTPYLAALTATAQIIYDDPDLNATGNQAPLYEIIFLSDGYPTDALNLDGSVDVASLDAMINKISALAPGRVFLSGAYYGTINDPVAASTLQNMASTGQGQFVNADTGSTSSISIDNLITIPTSACE